MKVRRMRDRRDQASAASHRRGAKLLTAISAAAVLAGCSSVPDEMNPVEWYRGASAWVAGDEGESTASSLAEPASEDVPFPNLASVPERPEPTPEPTAVEEMIASLEADRSAAQVADAELRSRPATEARVPLPTPSSVDDPGTSRRFPPLELPDLRSALGDTETVRTGRFSDVERDQEAPTATPAPRSVTSAATPAPQAAAPAPATPPAAAPAPRSVPARPARDLASARDVAPRMPIQPPVPFSTGRRSFASTMDGAPASAPSASARVTPRPPVQPPQPYSAPRSSMSKLMPAAAGAEISLAEWAR